MPTIRGSVSRVALVLAVLVTAAACTSERASDQPALTIYAGRSQTLVQPLLEQFSKDTGIPIKVRYGDGTDLALGILEEGRNSPADVYLTQDIGAMGALRADGRLATLSPSVLERVPAPFRDSDGLWVGLSGRARVIAYNTETVRPESLPASVLDYTRPEWRLRIGIVPRSDGFPEFVTALRLLRGQDFARQWLLDLKANAPRTYPNNVAALTAVANREVDVAFLNHYYLYRFLEEQGPGFPVRNAYFTNGDIGGLFLVSAAAVLESSANKPAAERFVAYLLERSAQEYFASKTHEYPLVAGVQPAGELPALDAMQTPTIDLAALQDLRGSLELMRATGIIP